MFVDAIRRYVEQLPPRQHGMARRACATATSAARWRCCTSGPPRLDDRRLEQPGGLSRSALHERFVALIGEPPMQYLAQLAHAGRVAPAARERATVATVAIDVGYDSEAAFARAFKRLVGMPPAAWRRAHEPATARA